MKVVLDTNILIDVADSKRSGFGVSARFLDLCVAGLIEAYVPAFSMVNIVYILSCRAKLYDLKGVEQLYKCWAQFIHFEPLSDADVGRGFQIGFKDYEDGLHAICAEGVGADYIVTDNVKDYQNSPVLAITPQEFFRDIFVSAKV